MTMSDHASRIVNQQIIWRNEFADDRLPEPGPPPVPFEVTRAECAGDKIHVWYAVIPAVPAGGEDDGWTAAMDRATWENQAHRAGATAERERIRQLAEETDAYGFQDPAVAYRVSFADLIGDGP